MRKRDKTLIAGAAAALAVAGAGAAIAGTDGFSPDQQSQAVIDDAAKALGVEPSELTEALKQGLENRIDEAVEAGRITEEQADALKKRLETADVPLVLGGLGPVFGGAFGERLEPGFGHFGHFGYFANLEAAATYLGVSDDELRDALRDGKSLADIAKAEGKSVSGLVDALVAEAEERIDAAVGDGRLSEERAAELKQALDERVTDLVNREPVIRESFRDRRFGPGFDPGFDPGFGPGHDGPHPFRGPRA